MALTKIDDRGLKTPIDLLDDEKIRFGTDNDLELYHTGSHGYILNKTGNKFEIDYEKNTLKFGLNLVKGVPDKDAILINSAPKINTISKCENGL